MIVIDASLALDMFLMTPDAVKIRSRIEGAGRAMHAPEVFDLEILQTLRRLSRAGTIEMARADAALGVYRSAPIERHGHALLTARIWALRENLTAYDGAYFALAELLGAPLFTRDKKFTSVPGHRVQVEIL